MDEIAVIGGAEVYRQIMDKADRLVITRVQLQSEGDTIFPPVDDGIWKEVSRTGHPAGSEDEASFTIQVFERRELESRPAA